MRPSEHDARREEYQLSRRSGDFGISPGAMYNPPVAPLSGKEQIAKVLDILFRRKWIVIIGFAVILGLTVLYTANLTPQYEASSYIMVDLGKVSLDIARSSSSDESDQGSGFELFASSDRTLAGEIRLLEISDQLEQRVDQRMQENLANAGNGNMPVRRMGYVSFVTDRGSDNILRFIGRSSNADQAAALANMYAQEYVNLTREASRAQALSVREALVEKEREQLEELTQIEEQINRYKQLGITDLDSESSRLVQLIAATDLEEENARVELSVEKAALASLEKELEEVNPVLAQRIASGVDRKLDALQVQLAEDEDSYSKILIQNPELKGRETSRLRELDDRIKRLRVEIDSLSAQYVNEVAAAGGITGSSDGLAYVASLRQEIAEKRVEVSRLEAMVDVLGSRLREYQASMQRLPRQSKELAQLERARVRTELKYQNTSDQLQVALVQEESEPGYAQVVRNAEVPFGSIYPNIPQNIILGSFLGLMIGLVLAIGREKLDNRIYQPEQLRSMGYREIGVVPNMKPMIKKEFKGKSSVDYDGLNVSTALVSLHDPVASSAEAYRYIRTHIHFGVPGADIQTLLVTSPGVSEGKSTTAANLAIVMAQAGRKTLLLDGDLRRPKIHRLFGLPLDTGVIENLTESANFTPESWTTPIENLSVLTAGNPVSYDVESDESASKLPRRRPIILNPSEMLGSTQMRDLVSTLREVYDIIIIDTPPVLVATDAALLAAEADATVMVARSGVTKEGEVDRAVETLDSVGAAFLGIILNGFDINMAFGHRYKYQDYTQYGQYTQYGYHSMRSEK